jgi:hypothetical protein
LRRLKLRGLIIIMAAASLWAYLIIFWPSPSKELIESQPWVLEGRRPLYVALIALSALFLTLFGPVLFVSDLLDARRKKPDD